jgi:hypothetical protein
MTTYFSAGLAWGGSAEALSDWAWRRLINRRDFWGGYATGQVTFPAKHLRGHVLLSRPLLTRHFIGRRREDIIGLHSTSPENTSRWGALDIDHHGPGSAAPEVNRQAALS